MNFLTGSCMKFPQVTICVLAAIAATGCGVSPIYHHQAPLNRAGISNRSQWRASGGMLQPGNAIDGDVNTSARARIANQGGSLTVDLAKASLFNMVVLDHGNNNLSYRGEIVVLTSLGGEHFTRRYAVPATRRVSIVCLPSPVLARFVRVEMSRPSGTSWAIAEMYLQ